MTSKNATKARGSLFYTKDGDFDPAHALVIGAFLVGVVGFLWEVVTNNGASGPAWAWLGGGTGGAIVGGGMHAFARTKYRTKTLTESDEGAEI